MGGDTIASTDLQRDDALAGFEKAIQRDQRGDFVLVVDDENTVEQRYIQTGGQIETTIIIETGLSEGETVIVEGLQRVRPGVAVDPILAALPGQ